jgi:hypothetical protein
MLKRKGQFSAKIFFVVSVCLATICSSVAVRVAISSMKSSKVVSDWRRC